MAVTQDSPKSPVACPGQKSLLDNNFNFGMERVGLSSTAAFPRSGSNPNMLIIQEDSRKELPGIQTSRPPCYTIPEQSKGVDPLATEASFQIDAAREYDLKDSTLPFQDSF